MSECNDYTLSVEMGIKKSIFFISVCFMRFAKSLFMMI